MNTKLIYTPENGQERIIEMNIQPEDLKNGYEHMKAKYEHIFALLCVKD